MSEDGQNMVSGVLRRSRQKEGFVKVWSDPEIGEGLDCSLGRLNPGQWVADPATGLPNTGEMPFPVTILGKDGDDICLVDTLGQFTSVGPSQFGQGVIQSMFGDRQRYLYWAFPRFNRDMQITGWKAEQVREVMYFAANRRGIFTVLDRVRGLGGWTDKSGELLWHAGDLIWQLERNRDGKGVAMKAQPAGEHDGYFYTRRPDTVTPWPTPVGWSACPAREILRGLKTWNWTRPIDPLLLVGWIGCAFLGGALEWRPACFITGDRAVGKSTLQALMRAIFGNSLHSTADATAAGIYQRVKQDSLPVGVDEFEAGGNNARVKQVFNLARLAASGSVMYRGGADHKGTEFRAQNCFLFSSINIPPLHPQDLSRTAILRLAKLDKARSAEKPMTVDADTCGSLILRRLFDEWHNYPKLREAYREALREAGGHDGRGQDTYGTLLAVAHMLLGDEGMDEAGYPVETLDKWGELLPASALPENENASENWIGCLVRLLTSPVSTWRDGGRQTVGALLEEYEESGPSSDMNFTKARNLLQQAGLGLLPAGQRVKDSAVLAIPNNSQLVANLYRDSDWAGAGQIGGWADALRQGPPEIVLTTKNQVKVNGVNVRCTLIVLKRFHELMEKQG
ncbi:hypothetical protein SAMN04515666_101327 [Bosea lupini]|uniref:DUF927 domain-containing protein n=1 Tax=Bosea lupini TaxID=1036779 RepID=A0A1H7GFJ5_9HYPH|nr:hypothetical protein [Bosea lupini]SEK36287.1 hypothetical protein SAMN04515666_101327 [Bosea lupini]